ncbi:hypothetical protein [Thermoleptolyngbya sp.]
MLHQSASCWSRFSQGFGQNPAQKESQIWGGRVRAIARLLPIAASAAAVVCAAPTQATELLEPRPSAPESAESTHLDAENSLVLAVVAEDAAMAEESRGASKFSSLSLRSDSLPSALPQPQPVVVADAQFHENALAQPPLIEPHSPSSAQLLLDGLPTQEATVAQEATVEESVLAQGSPDPLDEPFEPDLEPVDLPELEPAGLPEGKLESQEFFEEVPPDALALEDSRPRGRRWQVTVEPYFFIPLDVRADIAALGRSTRIRADLDDFLDLDRAFDGGLRIDAQTGRFGILLDGYYLSLANSGTLPVTFPAGSLLRFGIPFEVEGRADASASLRQGKIDLAAYYRVVNRSLRRSPTPSNPFPFLLVDPILGLRTNISRREIEIDELRIGPNTIPIDREFSDSRTTLEPLVGLRVGLQLSPRWSLGLEGNVSGFNINAERDTTWNFQAGVGYSFSRSVALRIAYVYSGYEFRDGSGLRRSEVDLDQHGLGLWLSIRF